MSKKLVAVLALSISIVALAAVVSVGAFANGAQELSYACASTKNGLLRAASSPSDCDAKKETVVTFSVASPVDVCVQPGGSVRLIPPRNCLRTKGTVLTVPSNTPAYFCADTTNGGVLRKVSDPTQCSGDETAYVVASHAPTDTALSNSSVPENQPAGTNVGTLTTTDPDAGDTHTYSIACTTPGADDAKFGISGSTLQTAAPLDYEADSTLEVCIRTTDGTGGTFDETFQITVTNANDPPSKLSLSPSSVAENQPVGTTVGTLSTTDQDAGATHTYTLVAGSGDDDNASFQISGSTLQTNAVFDYETKNSYSIRVRSDDGAGGTFETSLNVTITNVDEP